jgi:hypothetical protein
MRNLRKSENLIKSILLKSQEHVIRSMGGYLKIHLAVDIRKQKIVSMAVTSEEVHDGKY